MENIPLFILFAVISSFFVNASALIYKIHYLFKPANENLLTLDDLAVFKTAVKLESARLKSAKNEEEIDLSGDLEEVSIQ